MNTNYNISADEFASIEQYLLEETSTEQRLAFEEKMAKDSVWAAKVNEIQLLFAAIETTALKERLDDYHSNIKKNQPLQGGGKIISLKLKWLVAVSVAIFAFVSILFFITSENKYEKLYAAYYKADPGLMSAMGVSDNYVFNKAMLDYKTGNYKKAIDEWSKLKAVIPSNDTLEYFLAVAQQADDNNETALILLQSIMSDAANPFYKDACWYTGLALLKKGNVDKAIPYLEKSDRKESKELISKLKQ